MTPRVSSWIRWTVAAALCLGAALAFVVRVPRGALAAIGRPGAATARLETTGWHLRIPFVERTVLVPAELREIEGSVPVTSPEGASMSLPFRARLDPGGASAALILDRAPDGDLGAAVSREIERSLRADGTGAAVYVNAAGSEAPGAIEERLAGLGVVAGSLALSPAAAAKPPAPETSRLAATYAGPAHPILVVGIDSADWSVMGPMIERGELPVLGRMKASGAWGSIRSSPPMLSPLLWTTVATGKTPEQHGIVDFLARDPGTGKLVPITSGFRRVKALWSILTDLRTPSLTVGWWATWPAEKVAGVMITDRMAFSLMVEGAEGPIDKVTWPPEIAVAVAPLRLGPDRVPFDDLREIIDVDRSEYERARAALSAPDSWSDPVAHLLRILAATRTYHRIALERLRSGQPVLSLVYYEGLDEVNHRFAHYAEPAMKWAVPSKVPAFRDAVRRFYRLQDRLLGDLLAAVRQDTVVLVLSDHGFAWGDARPEDVPPDIEGKPGRWHMPQGILLATGPTVRPGRISRDPSLLDVAPTILALLSLPAAADMPGSAITEIVSGSDRPPAPDPATVATYEGGESAHPSTAAASPVDPEMMAKLVALGYVGSGAAAETLAGPEAIAPPAGSPGTVTGHVNTGNILLAKGEYAAAEREYRAGLGLAPAFVPARLGWAQCLVLGGDASRAAEGWREIEATLREGSDLDAAIYLKIARFMRGRGRAAEGARVFDALPARPGLEAARHTARALLLAAAGDRDGSRHALTEALASDPAFPEALEESYRQMTASGEIGPLGEILGKALEARPGGVVASNLLALTWERSGRAADAIAILDGVRRAEPRDLPTIINLAGIHLRSGDPGAAVPLLRKAREIAPRNLEALVNLIVALGRSGDLEGARAEFRTAGETASERPDVLNALAYACWLGGRADEAKDLLHKSLERRRDQPEARRLLETIESPSSAPPAVSKRPPGL